MKYMIRAASLILLFCGFSASANNTSGVHGPVINPDDSSAMYRMSFVPGEDGDDDKWAHRFHYQRALNEQFRWRLITQFRERNTTFELDYLRAELLYFFHPKEDGIWDSAVRFDIRERKGSRPAKFAINWTNQWSLSPRWQLRGILIPAWDFGKTADHGTKLETRASLNYKLDSGVKVGVEMFNEFGKISDMGSFDDQEHQIGPVVSGKAAGLKYQIGYLAGVSDAADDHDVRLWLSKSF